MNYLEALRHNYKRYKESWFYRSKFTYTSYYDKIAVNDREILFQSYDGNSISCSPYYLLEETCTNPKYAEYKKYVVSRNGMYDEISRFIADRGFKNVEIVKMYSKEYCFALLSAKYLVTNSTFPSFFVKKSGQVYLNTWHGTPLKAMGRNIYDAPNELGNTQRNFLMADYLLFPNRFTYEHMRADYMISNYFNGKYILDGYPRNSAFYRTDRAAEIRKKLGLTKKRVAVYMPTWRGILKKRNSPKPYAYFLCILYELDRKIDGNTVLYVKAHNYATGKIPFDEFKHIKPFPNEYETYEFLNIADCLITDYSSVFFDFANTGKKIILFGYDSAEYLKSRGMYLDYNSLPFVFVNKLDDLAAEINNPDFPDYGEYMNDFIRFDHAEAAAEVCSLFINGEKSEGMEIIDGKSLHNGKSNVMIFTGSLLKNGITTALMGLLNNIDKSKYNYVLVFYQGAVENNKYKIREFSGFDYMPIQGQKLFTESEALYHSLYFRGNIDTPAVRRKMKRIYEREYKRLYPGMNFEYVIHFSGYERHIMHLMKYMDAKKIIYIHNDMKKEQLTKRTFDEKSLFSCLENCDKIVCVRESSCNEILEYHKKINPEKVVVAHNLNNIESIQSASMEPIKFDGDTYCNVSIKELKRILADKGSKKFITIGRYSPEKGHKRLINAFLKYNKKYADSYLIIVGGYGDLFDDTVSLVEQSGSKNIILIRSLSNPFPILRQCDAFVLSSHYEGLPMTVMEALILNKPVISTDIKGPSEFLGRGYGHIVENSEEGILKGLVDWTEGKLPQLTEFDAEMFNKKAVEEFNALFD